MSPSRTKDPIVRQALTNKRFKHAGLLTASEYEKLSKTGERRLFGLIGDDRRVSRQRGRDRAKWKQLGPGEWSMLIGYVKSPGESRTPRAAHGGAGSHKGALFTFKSMRRKVDEQVERRSWELFHHDGVDARGNDVFSFRPPPGFRYVLVLPYVPDDVPELSIVPSPNAFYEVFPGTGVYVDVVLDKKVDWALPIYDAYVEIPAVGRSVPPRTLPICRLIADAVPDPDLPVPPFSLPAGECLVQGTWPFELLDQEAKVIRKDTATPATLCVEVGAKGRIVRLSISVRRRRYR